MSRLIDADALKDFYGKWSNEHTEFTKPEVDHYIDVQPTIEAEPVRHGRWELHGNDDDCGCSYFCSECHKSYDEDWFYTHGEYTPFKCCPNCYARMNKEDV